MRQSREKMRQWMEWQRENYDPEDDMKPTINTSNDGKCGYIAFYDGKQAEVWADSLFQAKQRAVAYFKPKKNREHMVSVVLAEVEGQQVTHTPDF